MDREKTAQRMEEVVRSYRQQLAENEDSTFSNMGNSVKMGFESLKGAVSGSEEEKHAISMFKRYADDFEGALKKNDRTTAQKALDDLEKSIQGFRIQGKA